MGTPDLPALLARVEAATGPDRALAREIQCAIGGWHRITPSQGGGQRGAYIAPEEWNGRMSTGHPILDGMHGTTMHRDVPDVTSSLDATVALVEKLGPGIRIDIIKRSDGTGYGCIWTKSGNRSNNCATPPLALLAALLRSMIEEEGR